tara:strand:+ start:150 stop:377 length:228 start_codon:yes stop_codon:yes gene_type:complete
MATVHEIGHLSKTLVNIDAEQVWMLSCRCENCGQGWNVERGDDILICFERRVYYAICGNCKTPVRCNDNVAQRFE